MGLNNWAIVRIFRTSAKQTVGAIVFEPISGDVFYAHEGEAFYMNTNFLEIEPNKLIVPEKIDFPIKAMIGNFHRKSRAEIKIEFQARLYDIGQIIIM